MHPESCTPELHHFEAARVPRSVQQPAMWVTGSPVHACPPAPLLLTFEKRLRMRPTGVVSKKVTGARTRDVRHLWWMTLEARSALSRLLADRMTVSSVKPVSEGGKGRHQAKGGQLTEGHSSSAGGWPAGAWQAPFLL